MAIHPATTLLFLSWMAARGTVASTEHNVRPRIPPPPPRTSLQSHDPSKQQKRIIPPPPPLQSQTSSSSETTAALDPHEDMLGDESDADDSFHTAQTEQQQQEEQTESVPFTNSIGTQTDHSSLLSTHLGRTSDHPTQSSSSSSETSVKLLRQPQRPLPPPPRQQQFQQQQQAVARNELDTENRRIPLQSQPRTQNAYSSTISSTYGRPPVLSSQQQQQQQYNSGYRMPPQQYQQPYFQQQQQRQQQQRMPPQQYRSPPSRQQRHAQKPPSWTSSLWKTINRGLDVLVDVEDAVTDRSKQLYQKAQTVRRSRPPPPQQQQVQELDWSRFQKKVATPSHSNQDAPIKVHPSTAAAGANSNLASTTSAATNTASQKRVADWNALLQNRPVKQTKIGNGGASHGAEDDSRRPSILQQQRPDPVPPTRQQPPPRRPFPDEDDDDEETRGGSFVAKLTSMLPRPPRLSNPFRRRYSGELAHAALDAWRVQDEESMAKKQRRGWFRKSSVSPPIPESIQFRRSSLSPIVKQLERYVDDNNNKELLTVDELVACLAIGRRKALFDLGFLALVLIGLHQLPIHVLGTPQSLEGAHSMVAQFLAAMSDSIDIWMPLAFVSAFLVTRTRHLMCKLSERRLAARVASKVEQEALYGSMFLRMTSSHPVDRHAPSKLQDAVRAKVALYVSLARLKTFVFCVLASFAVMTVTFVRPLIEGFTIASWKVALSPELRQWPVSLRSIADMVVATWLPVWSDSFSAMQELMSNIALHPLGFAFKSSFCLALVLVAFLPAVLYQRLSSGSEQSGFSEEDHETDIYARFSEVIASSGMSGANRMSLLAVDSRIESVLERWRTMIPESTKGSPSVPFPVTLRQLMYGFFSTLILSAPLFFFFGVDVSSAISTNAGLIPWLSAFNVSSILLLTQLLAWKALSKTTSAFDFTRAVNSFVVSLSKAVRDRRQSLEGRPASLSQQASISPTAGISVRDLWASHSTKRAWAVRGANLSCSNGEVLLVLGEDGSGKTRLMTSIVESVVSPSAEASTTKRVRGLISVGGVDIAKWDSSQLKKRMGISLNDVRSVSDAAQLLTGLSLEEILDPRNNPSVLATPGANERAAMMLALKMTGLYSTLLRHLPSKMATIVTANESDLLPSPLRPRYHLLSAAEWSKLLLARVIAQAIYDNEISAGTNDSIENSLMGSTVMIDDFTNYLSEVEEAEIIRNLRDSGAATIVTTNRWATGRFADKIAVVKDGAIVEVGEHSDLLDRGPTNSVYAAKWAAIASTSNS